MYCAIDFLIKNACKMINWQDRIDTNPKILLGKPIIKGTRLSVEFILERLATGWSFNDLLENYPRLTVLDIQAVFAYSYESMKDGMLFQTTKKAA
jgi:uncharacterized protein (DUF433 family)